MNFECVMQSCTLRPISNVKLENSSLGANMKLHKGGVLSMGTRRNVSDVSSSSLQQRCNGSFFRILLFAYSAIKGPVKELINNRLSFMSGEKHYFQGLRALKCHLQEIEQCMLKNYY